MGPMEILTTSKSINIDFHVPLRHQLRFTHDCFGADWSVVESLLESEHSDPRVQVWIDHGVVASSNSLLFRLKECLSRSGRIQLTSPPHEIAGGEQIKASPDLVEEIFATMNRDGLDRRSYVLVIGGGAVLDAVGYAAAIAHRGIRLIRFPTTTLAQADSGVGVKNAVNAFGKKNWKGTFAVPWGVVNDSSLLECLSDRDFRSGFSEALKVSLLKSESAFEELYNAATEISQRDMLKSLKVIHSSVMMHLHHITQGGDPFEANEARPLDFGHWSAHKLESRCDYQIRHGEAVAIGVALDVVYSSLAHGLDTEVVSRALETLDRLGLPTYHEQLEERVLFEGLEEFRQHLGGRLTLTMLKAIGEMTQVHEIDYVKMRQAIAYLKGRSERSGQEDHHE
jgi:3-dehydroquinate synthase